MKNIIKIITILLLALTFSCADKKQTSSAESDYIKAVQKLKDKDYSKAAEDFKKIGDEYPLSKWGARAGTMAAYAFYKEEKLEEVITTVDDFIRNNPGSPDVAYMQYLKSIAYYDQMNDIARSQDNAKAASYSFRELIARFPDSKYTDDSKQKLILVDEHIAGAKMSVGRFQIKDGNYVGAIKNFQDVINSYSRTKQAPEAYFRLYEVYQKIGLTAEAEEYKKELDLIYPDNKWTNKN